MANTRIRIAALLIFGLSSIAQAFEPQLDLQHSISLSPSVYGKTNLPDGAQLMLTMSRPDIQYVAQKKMVVKNGKFLAGGFSDRGSSLQPGKYNVEIGLVASALNPPNVRAVIGDRGENMTGRWVQKGMIDEKEFIFRAIIDVASPTPPANLPVERSSYLERAVIDRCKEMVYTRNQAMESGALPGTAVRGTALREKVRECIHTAVPAESAGYVLERFDTEG
jgi:hypothetical protein